MSNMKSCNCPAKYRRVEIRNGNYSYFEYPKGQLHASAYSQIRCINCGQTWRTKAKWVAACADLTDAEMEELEATRKGGIHRYGVGGGGSKAHYMCAKCNCPNFDEKGDNIICKRCGHTITRRELEKVLGW